MEKRLKVFCGDNLHILMETINWFLKETDGCLHDVLYQHQLTEDNFDYSVILIYTPKKEEKCR